jgi:hypothetical protein
MLQNIFWMASFSSPSDRDAINQLLPGNPDAFCNMWKSLVSYDSRDSDRSWLGKILIQIVRSPLISRFIAIAIDIMLSSQTNIINPFVKRPTVNILAVQSLLQIPLEVLLRSDRERIMKGWLPITSPGNPENFSYESTTLDANVLSLKVKIMKRPTFYEVRIFISSVGSILISGRE